MIRPPRTEDAVEELDRPIADRAAHETSLGHLRGVNRWLGGTRALRLALEAVVQPGDRITLVDAGCGAADVPLALSAWAAARDVDLVAFALDRAEASARVARRRTRNNGRIHVLCADAMALPLGDGAADIATMNLTLHHFDGAGRIAVLSELARVARRLIVVNDLERSWPNYVGARILAATLWRRNRFTRNDGPLSVLRSFTPGELLSDLRRAGLLDAAVRRRFFYRLVATGRPSANAAAARTL
jgi:hypothetical protein